MGQFFVNNPGNLSNPQRLGDLNNMVYELEHMNGSWGPDSSNYFVRDFIAYENVFDESDEDDTMGSGKFYFFAEVWDPAIYWALACTCFFNIYFCLA